MHGPCAIAVQRTIGPQRDDGRLDPTRDQRISRAFGIGDGHHSNPRQRLRLGFVGRDIVAQRQHGICQRRRRCRVQDRYHPRRTCNLQTAQGGWDRLFQLRHKDCRTFDQRRVRLDVLHGNAPRSPRRYDDGVVARGRLDKDIGRPGIAVLVHGHMRMHTRAFPCRPRDIGERIIPQPRDEMRLPPGHGRSHCLIRPLPSGPQYKGLPKDGFTHFRLPFRPIGRVGNKDAKNNNRFHVKPPVQSRPCET